MGGHIFEILVMLLIAAILGFAIAWFWRQKRITELETYIKALEEKNNQLLIKLNETEKTLLDCQADKKNLDAEKERLEKQLANCKTEKDKFEVEKNETSQLLSTCQSDSKKLEEDKEYLENLLANCETEKNETIQLLKNSKADNKKLDKEKTKLDKSLKNCKTEKEELNSDKKDIEKLLIECQSNLMTSGVELFNKEIDNEKCADELLETKSEVIPKKPLSKQDQAIERVKAKAAKIDFARIGTANESEKDDLKIIKGIGPFIEKKLNALGIFRFIQIANLNDEDKDLVNEAIEFFTGRIKRDDWVGQSIELAKS